MLPHPPPPPSVGAGGRMQPATGETVGPIPEGDAGLFQTTSFNLSTINFANAEEVQRASSRLTLSRCALTRPLAVHCATLGEVDHDQDEHGI